MTKCGPGDTNYHRRCSEYFARCLCLWTLDRFCVTTVQEVSHKASHVCSWDQNEAEFEDEWSEQGSWKYGGMNHSRAVRTGQI